LTEKKELQVISDILLRNPIALPDDFSVSAETAAPASGPKTPVKAKSAAGAKSRPAAPRTTKKRS
jgi:hypothetical protein